jgi:hypothetical protein
VHLAPPRDHRVRRVHLQRALDDRHLLDLRRESHTGWGRKHGGHGRGRFGLDTFGIGEDTGQQVTIEYKALPTATRTAPPTWLDPLELIEKLCVLEPPPGPTCCAPNGNLTGSLFRQILRRIQRPCDTRPVRAISLGRERFRFQKALKNRKDSPTHDLTVS